MNSPFITSSRGSKVTVKLDRAVVCEVDGGVRGKATKLTFKARPGFGRDVRPDG